MKLYKLFFSIMFIAAFVYLVMCPSVHELGDNIRHDVTLKVGTKTLLKDFKKGSNFIFSKLSHNTQNVFFAQSRTTQELPIISSSHSTLHLSIISTIRLILWFLHPHLSTVSWYRDRNSFYSYLLLKSNYWIKISDHKISKTVLQR